MPAVEGIALAIGIAGGALGLSTIAVVLCTAVTVIREGKVSVLVGSIWSTAFCACMAGTCTALQWVYPWAPSQARACETLAGVVGFFCNIVEHVGQTDAVPLTSGMHFAQIPARSDPFCNSCTAGR